MDALPPAPDRSRAWKHVVVFVGVVVAAKALFVMLSGFGLAGDEAHYWEWSRRLDLSYYSKGPGIAWLMALTRATIGDAEWMLRVPSSISWGVACACCAALAARCAPDVARAPARWHATLAFAMLPVFHVASLFMTIDAPYVACWALSALLGWVCLERWRAGKGFVLPALALGLALGTGFLFKYTILLLVPGLVIAAFFVRRSLAWGRTPALGLSVGTGAALLTMSPVVAWNAREGWPTLRHLMGHLGMEGGDVPGAQGVGSSWTPLWTIEYLALQLAIVGPAMALFVLAMRAPRDRFRDGAKMYLLACAAPILLGYLAVSLVSGTEANWPIAGYVTLASLAGVIAPGALGAWRAKLAAWHAMDEPRPKQGLLRQAPESPFQIAWHWSAGYAIGACVLIALVPLLVALGVALPVHRVSEGSQLAAQVGAIRESLRAATGAEPAIIAKRYQHAGLLAYYLEDHPSVRSAASAFGDRKSSYDFFDDTRLDDPAILGGPAIIVGSSAERVREVFAVDDLKSVAIEDARGGTMMVHTTTRYHGPKGSP